MLWDLWQQHRLNNLEQRLNAQESESRDEARDLAKQVLSRMDNLVLAHTAMWELVKEKLQLSDEELARKMEEIDVMDGVRDGKISARWRQCRRCGRKSRESRVDCLYCGGELSDPRSI